jgi:hypothetical protein
MTSWLTLLTEPNGWLLTTEGEDHDYYVHKKANGTYNVFLGTWKKQGQKLKITSLVDECLVLDMAINEAVAHESHVYQDDGEVLLAALVHGEMKILYPDRLPEHLDGFWSRTNNVIPAPTPSLLFWLFADKLVSAHADAADDDFWNCADAWPAGQGVKVNQKEYATTVVGVAFWNLRRKGYITLEPYTKKRWGLFTRSEAYTIRGLRASLGPEARYDANDSLEYLILLALRNRSSAGVLILYDRQDVSRITSAIMRYDAWNPYAALLRLPEGEALRTGCMVRVDAHRNKVMALVKGDTKLEIDTARVATFQSAFETERAAWEQFKTSEPDLYRALLDRCNAGIRSRKTKGG